MSQRIQVFDSMRGVAALQVVFHHYLIVFPLFFGANGAGTSVNFFIWLIASTPLHFFWAGHEAVVFFYLLSGFALALPFMDEDAPTYPSYLIRRIFRIWPPYVIAISLGVLMMGLGPSRVGIPEASPWFNGVWSQAVTGMDFVRLLFMIGNTNNVDPSTWSLVHEMRVSIFFPLIAWLVLRLNWVISLLVALGLVLSVHFINILPPSLVSLLKETVFYSSFFVVGALMAKYRWELKKWVSARKTPFKVAAALVALCLYSWKWLIGPFNHFSFDLRYFINSDPFTALGAVILMALALGSPVAQKVLDRPAFRWLGKISYSLYLIHPLVLVACVYLFRDIFPLSLSVSLAFGLSLGLSELYYRWVERPSVVWGHKLSESTGPALRRLING